MSLSPRKFLQYSQALEAFPLNVRNAIYARSEYRDYKNGDYIFRSGDEGPYFMAGVMSGRLRMGVRSQEGKEMLFTMVEKGEVFGEMSVLDELPRAVDVMATTDTTLMIMKRDDLLPHLRTCPEAMLSLFRITCYRMRLYIHTMELLALQNVTKKLGRYLLRLGRDYGVEKDGTLVISSHLSQADIGLQLGVSRESINKQLNTFAEQGFLRHSSDEIVLCDIEGLKRSIAAVGV